MENQAPIASVNCFITTGSTYQCDGSASDSDGTIASSSFTVDGVSMGSGSSIQYEFTNGGDHEVIYTVTDDLGKSTTAIKSISVNLPFLDFHCAETKEMVYQCFADSLVSPNQDDPIVSVNYIFDKNDILTFKNVEYEFYSFGSHEVVLKARTISGITSSVTKTITISQKHLAPRPEFVEDVGLNKSVYFDASFSQQLGRKVASYEWNFGDGDTFVTSSTTTTHTYQNLGWVEVTLKVTDLEGNSSSNTVPLYIYDPEVVQPGNDGVATIEGIDNDGDGVRDDIQVWINKNSFESSVAKKAMREFSTKLKQQIENISDSAILKSLENDKSVAAACIDSLIVSNRGLKKSSELEFLYFNSNDRVKKLIQIKEALNGYSSDMQDAETTDLCLKWR